MLIPALILIILLILIWMGIERWVDLREARIEARHKPQGEMVTVNGRHVHAVVHGDGPDLVLIHGAGGSSGDFAYHLIDLLAEQFRVIAFDRPGFGWSERIHDGLPGAFTTQAESPIEQARHLSDAARQLGADTPLVLGHSYGGAVAMGWALEAPLSGAVVVSGATMPWPGKIDWTYRVLGSFAGGVILPPVVSALVSAGYVDRILRGVFAPQDVPAGYLSRAGVMMATRLETLRANARQVNQLLGHVVEMSARYSEIGVPVEVLHGTEDKTVYREVHAEPLVSVLPDADLTILPGIGHMAHHAAPDDIVAAVERAAKRAGLR